MPRPNRTELPDADVVRLQKGPKERRLDGVLGVAGGAGVVEGAASIINYH